MSDDAKAVVVIEIQCPCGEVLDVRKDQAGKTEETILTCAEHWTPIKVNVPGIWIKE